MKIENDIKLLKKARGGKEQISRRRKVNYAEHKTKWIGRIASTVHRSLRQCFNNIPKDSLKIRMLGK